MVKHIHACSISLSLFMYFSRAIVGWKVSSRMTTDMVVNALAKTVNGLYKTEVIEYLKADWHGLADVQMRQ